MKKILLLNLYVLFFWIFCSSLSYLQYPFFSYLKSFSTLLVVFPLFGINLAGIAQFYNNKSFSKLEILSISSILALIIAPFLVTLEYEITGSLTPKFPIINALFSLALLLFLGYKNKSVDFSNFNFLNFSEFKNQRFSNTLKSPLFWAFFINLFAIIITFSAFGTLPELDPHYWYSVFLEQSSKNKIAGLLGYRPSFISLVYIFNKSANVDLFALFKYVLPLFTLLIMIPAYLAIKEETSKLKRFSILLAPFVTSSTFLYLQIPIPQAIFNIILFHFLFFLIYSQNTQKSFFYFLGGFAAFFSYFYHESAVIIFAIWMMVTIATHLKKIIFLMKSNLFSTFLLILIIFLNFSNIIIKQINFILQYITKPISFGNFNFLFPAQYVNIDGNSVGWEGWTGITKYYTYYIGPVFFLILLSLTYLLFIDPKFRDFFKKETRKKESAVILLLLTIFFSISEILPRLFNLALLPERAWMFSGIFSLIFVFYIFKFNYGKTFSILLIVSFLINLGGSLYINNLKKYTITKNQLVSAEWIKQKLPAKRIIFSNENKNLIQLYSNSKFIEVTDDFYFDETSYYTQINKFKNSKIYLLESYKKITEGAFETTYLLSKYDPISQEDEIKHLLEKNIQNSQETLELLISNEDLTSNNNNTLYIYYAKPDKKNPYLTRPYMKLHEEVSAFIFDKYPNQFKKIYTDQENNVIIWQIL